MFWRFSRSELNCFQKTKTIKIKTERESAESRGQTKTTAQAWPHFLKSRGKGPTLPNARAPLTSQASKKSCFWCPATWPDFQARRAKSTTSKNCEGFLRPAEKIKGPLQCRKLLEIACPGVSGGVPVCPRTYVPRSVLRVLGTPRTLSRGMPGHSSGHPETPEHPRHPETPEHVRYFIQDKTSADRLLASDFK